MKYSYIPFCALGVFLNVPLVVMLLDMFHWFFTDATLSGLVYGTSSRPLVGLLGTILSVPMFFIAGILYSDTH